MAEGVSEPWENDVDVTEMGEADLERRTAYLSLQDTSGDTAGIAQQIAEEWEISQAKATD